MSETESQTEHVHTIPVDPSLTPDQAWLELTTFGRRTTFTGREVWIEVECDGLECHLLQPIRD